LDIVSEYQDGRFRPDRNISREEMAAKAVAAAKAAGFAFGKGRDIRGFSDQGDTSGYADESVKLLQQASIVLFQA